MIPSPWDIGPARPRPECPDHPFRGSVLFHGVVIDLEHLQGDIRSGVDPDGVAWSVTLPAAYGEVRDTIGADRDPVDVFLGPEKFAPNVYVFRLNVPGSDRLDECKSLVGFPDETAARACFKRAYNRDDILAGVTEWTVPAWLAAMTRYDVHGGAMDVPLVKGRAMMTSSQSVVASSPRPRMFMRWPAT